MQIAELKVKLKASMEGDEPQEREEGETWRELAEELNESYISKLENLREEYDRKLDRVRNDRMIDASRHEDQMSRMLTQMADLIKVLPIMLQTYDENISQNTLTTKSIEHKVKDILAAVLNLPEDTDIPKQLETHEEEFEEVMKGVKRQDSREVSNKLEQIIGTTKGDSNSKADSEDRSLKEKDKALHTKLISTLKSQVVTAEHKEEPNQRLKMDESSLEKRQESHSVLAKRNAMRVQPLTVIKEDPIE